MNISDSKILKDLSLIFEKKNLKLEDKTSNLDQFDSIIILQIMNLAKIAYKKNISGLKLTDCKKILDIVKLIKE
jgi:acyl carrier protein